MKIPSDGLSFAVGNQRDAFRLSILLVLALGGLVSPGILSAASSNEAPRVELRLDDYLRQVLDHNESVQAQMLEAEVARRKARGELGVFEPELVASILREANKRRNNVQQQAQQQGEPFFSERNTIYDGSLQSLLPIGGKIRLGYTLSDLVNNVQPLPFFGGTNQFIQQYQTFVGVTFTQPILKNGGLDITLAGTRLAALDSDIAFQEYRRQLMLTLSQAEVAYWNLFLAQEQLRFFEESVGVAESILADSQEKLRVGQAAELEVLEAQSGLALRKTKQNEAVQNYYEAIGQLRTLGGGIPVEGGSLLIHAVDRPVSTNAGFSYSASFQQAFDLNPDYLIQRKKVDEEKLRLGVARNQLLPELDLKAAYGYNGLGRSPGDSWDMAQSQQFPSWSVGLELHVPLGGNIKGRNQFSAAQISLHESLVNLNGIETQLANLVNTLIQKARTWQDSIGSYQTIIRFNEDLLKTELARLVVGKVEPRKVLEVEADLFDSRQNLAEALVQYQRTMLQLQLASGSLLKSRNLDLTRYELREKTMALLKTRTQSPDMVQPVPTVPDSVNRSF